MSFTSALLTTALKESPNVAEEQRDCSHSTFESGVDFGGVGMKRSWHKKHF